MPSFRDSASFGKRMEHYLIGQMLKEGLDCYLPLVDDDGIDVVIRKSSGEYIEVQIKARSNEVAAGNAALFAALTHEKRSIWFNGNKINKETGQKEEHVHPRFEKYVATDFSRLR